MSSKILIPAAIIIAAVLIGTSMILTGGNSSGNITQSDGHRGGNTSLSNLRDITNEDHILGNPGAQVSIVEYSDFECPFCARLHQTLTRIVEDFDGEVNWVYRHFPLSSIHFRAYAAAEASECVAELGGNDAFWEFADGLFSNQSRLGTDLFGELANNLGISSSDLEACLDGNKHRAGILADRQDAINTGGRGTPHVVVINRKGDAVPFSGALPYENIRQIIEQVIES